MKSPVDQTLTVGTQSREEELKNVKLKSIDTTINRASISIFDEMKKVTLRRVESLCGDNKRPNKISKNESNFLQSSLQEAIKQRRIELTKNDVNESDEDYSDWSD